MGRRIALENLVDYRLNRLLSDFIQRRIAEFLRKVGSTGDKGIIFAFGQFRLFYRLQTVEPLLIGIICRDNVDTFIQL